jgi:hypothetical protein
MTDDVFLLDPRHAPFVNGESPYLHDIQLSWFQRLTIFGLVAASLFLAWSAIFADDNETVVYQVEADVIAREITGTEFNPRYQLTYTYTDHEGDMHTVERIVEEAIYDRTAVDPRLTVEYEDGRNQRAEPISPEAEFANLSPTLLVLIALIIGIVWSGYFWLLRPQRINDTLTSHGQLCDGRLENIWPTHAGRDYIVNVKYKFDTPAGKLLVGYDDGVRQDLQSNRLPTPGTPIRVLYVDDKLYRLM